MALQLARTRGWNPQSSSRAPGLGGPAAPGAVLPWRWRVGFRQRVSRAGPNSRGRRGLGLGPGEGRSTGDGVSGARSKRSLQPRRWLSEGHREAEGRRTRSRSKPPPLLRLRPLKGAGLFLSRRHKGIFISQSFTPALKGNGWALGRPPAAPRADWVVQHASR